MAFAPDEPYRIEVLDEGRAVVRFAPRCDQPRIKQQEDELSDLVARHDRVACDLTATSKMASEWLRWLVLLTQKAEQMGKLVAVVGMQDTVRATVDALGQRQSLRQAASLEEVWR